MNKEEVASKAEPRLMAIPRKIMMIGIDQGRGPGEDTVMFALANDGTTWGRVAPLAPESHWVQVSSLPDQMVPFPTEAELNGKVAAAKSFAPPKPGAPRLTPLGGEQAQNDRPNSGL